MIFGKVTDVYWWNRSSSRFFSVNQGGTSSSKTYSIIQTICETLMKEKLNALITSSHHHTLESGAKTDLKDIIEDAPILRGALINPDAEGNKILFKNGSRLIFKAYDKPKKARSGKRDILFINEANTISYSIAKELIDRTKKKVFIDYNSDTEFWVHEEILNKQRLRVDLFISNFTHNQYLPEETYRTLQEKLKRSLETDSEYDNNEWKVYGLGLTGSVAGTIFGDNYHKIPSFDAVRGLRKRAYIVDFGYTNDPTAIAEVGMKFGNVYGKQLLYESGHYGENLAIKLRDDLQLNPRLPMICDNDKASIQALQKYGFNARAAVKLRLMERITLMKQVQMYIDQESHDWHYEQLNYKFKQNPLTGKYTNTPIDDYNHLFDGLGYYLTAVFKGAGKKRGRKVAVR